MLDIIKYVPLHTDAINIVYCSSSIDSNELLKIFIIIISR